MGERASRMDVKQMKQFDNMERQQCGESDNDNSARRCDESVDGRRERCDEITAIGMTKDDVQCRIDSIANNKSAAIRARAQ